MCHTSNSSFSGLCPCPLPWPLETIVWASYVLGKNSPTHSACFRDPLCSPPKARTRWAAMPIWHYVVCGNPNSGPLARALSIEPSPLFSQAEAVHSFFDSLLWVPFCVSTVGPLCAFSVDIVFHCVTILYSTCEVIVIFININNCPPKQGQAI